jgi:hypothetical protein
MIFSFELNENIEPSKFVIALLDLHAQFKDQQNPSTYMRKYRMNESPASERNLRRCSKYL